MENAAEILLWHKYLYWKKGIPTRVFREEYMSDMREVMDLDNAIQEKAGREQQIQQMLGKIKW